MTEKRPSLHWVVTADMIDSRSHFQHQPEFLKEIRDRLAKMRYPSMMMSIDVFRGDEIQGLFREPTQLPSIIRHLRFACLPLMLRVGIGAGAIDEAALRTTRASPWEISGEAFFRARDAVETLKEKNLPATQLRCGDEKTQKTVNTVYMLIDAQMQGWTPRQWEAIHAYEDRKTMVLAAEALGIAHQNIAKLCARAHWKTIQKAESFLSETMSALHTSAEKE